MDSSRTQLIELEELLWEGKVDAEIVQLEDCADGSVLVGADGPVLAEERNHVGAGDRTQYPEFALARWAANNMTPKQRAAATVFTSGEHGSPTWFVGL